jgi:hypothetical protein
MKHRLTPEIAARFAEIALGHVRQEYPHKLDHVMDGPEDVLGPRQLHPIFYGSFDWHSCVHGYWLLLRVRRLFPDLDVCRRIDTLVEDMLIPDKVAGERDYLFRAYSDGFERPYGWAWLLALHREAGDVLELLARDFADRFTLYLPRLTYPIRTGTHFNTAFALILALDWAEAHDELLAALIRDRAVHYYGGDRACQAWEPSGDDFLSPALTEALCMKRVLAPERFADWFTGFLPEVPRTLTEPAFVSDRSDGKIAHLDGLNLSRAWCWRELGRPDLAEAHLDASLPHVAGDYVGEHWLATFALLALAGESREASYWASRSAGPS